MLIHSTCTNCGTPYLPLTPRQTEVVEAVAASPGATNEEIARTLSMSVNTLRTHLRTIYRRLGVESRSECLAMYFQAGTNREQ